jgi:hypothetical protein
VFAVLATIFLMIDMLNGVAGSFAIFQWTKDYLPGSVVVNGTDVYRSHDEEDWHDDHHRRYGRA